MGLEWMLAPVVACLVAALVLGWFGLHVLERGVIFVDLALAQVAALGTTFAVFLGHEPDAPLAYVFGLAATAIGAVAFSLARRFEARVPQEAIIGIAYAVGAAAAAVVLDFARDPHGAEKLQHLTVGNVVWVTWTEIGAMTAIVAAVAAVHFAVRRQLIEVSFAPAAAEARGVSVAAWDLVFYLTFGVVITAIVHVAGVLLIFSYLIVPAVIARLFVDGVLARLLVAWAVAVPLSIAGVAVSYEHAAGPIIVVLLGAALFLALAVYAVRTSPTPTRVALGVAATVGGLVFALWGITQLDRAEVHDHDHGDAVAAATHPRAHDDLPPEADPGQRETWYRAHLHQPELLHDALIHEEDPSLRLLLGTVLARAGDVEGLQALAGLTREEVPFLRLEADDRLRAIAGEAAPAYDPLAGPDTGRWAAWVAEAPPGWPERAAALPPP